MRTRTCLFLFTTILFFLGLSFSCKYKSRENTSNTNLQDTFPNPDSKTEIELKNTFPKKKLLEKGISLWSSWHMTNDPNGNVYVSDQKMERILKFNSDGNFLAQIGRTGEGPGEFRSPSDLIVTEEGIIIKEISRIQFLNKKGDYLSSFKDFKGYHSIEICNDGSICAAPIIVRQELKLIDILSKEGEVLFSFGDCLKFEKELAALNQCSIAINDNNIYIAFFFFPIVRKYSLNGTLLAEFKLNYESMVKKEKRNLKSYKSSLKGQKKGFWTVINNIQATKNGFYLLHMHQIIEILEFDSNGNLKASYWCNRPKEFSAIDFFVQNENNIKSFYLLEYSPQNEVSVFRPK